jgi:hypothetical protein
MIIDVITENSTQKFDANSTFFVEQANSRAMADQQTYCKLSGKIVKALVPANVSTVGSQTDEKAFTMLIACYEACINQAVSAGAKQICIRPLGTGVQLTKIDQNGEVVLNGLWGDLFWTHAKSSTAAKKAVENTFQTIPDAVSLTFIVPKENFDDWAWAYDFEIV